MKDNIVSYLFLFVVSGLLLSSCGNRPKEVLNRRSMERLMYDVYIAEATMENDYQHFDTPEKKEAYIREIFRQHKVTQAQWDTSLSWYSDRIDVYLRMNDSVKSRLQRAREAVDAQVSQQLAREQRDNLLNLSTSYIPPTYVFSTPNTKNGFSFRLDSADISQKLPDNHFSFHFSVIGIPPQQTGGFQALLTLDYRDTTMYQLQKITENQTYTIPVSKFIEDDTLTRISGFIHLQDMFKTRTSIQLYDVYLGNKTVHSNDSMLQKDEVKMLERSADIE